MAGIGDLGNGIGFLYTTDASSNIKSSVLNTPSNALKLLAQGLTSGPLSGEVLAIGSITMTHAGNITACTVNGVDVINATATGIQASTTLLAAALATNINLAGLYTAYSVGAVCYIQAKAGTGSTPNGYVIAATFASSGAGTIANMANGSPISGVYNAGNGTRFWINANYSGVAAEGVLTNAVEISAQVINRGFQTQLYTVTTTESSSKITVARVSNVTVAYVEGSNGDNLNTVASAGYNDSDIIILGASRTTSNVVTVTGTGNIVLANNVTQPLDPSIQSSIALIYDAVGNSWVELFRTPQTPLSVASLRAAGIAEPVQGVNATALTAGGGTINLQPGVDKGVQVYTSSAALAITGGWTIQIDAAPVTPYLDGDTMIVEYRATLDVTTHTQVVSIFGINLTALQALQGRIWLKAVYKLSNTTWYCDLSYSAYGVDLLSSSGAATTYEPLLPAPAAGGYILSSNTGSRPWSWIPNTASGISSIPSGKTTVVSQEFGVDVSGVVERADKPFATIAAARAAVNSFYTGGNAPSATNQPLIYVNDGNFTAEGIILDNYVNYKLNTGVIISGNTGGLATIDDNNVACVSIISGNGVIARTSATGVTSGIRAQNAGTSLTVYAYNVTNGQGVTINWGGATLNVNSPVGSTAAGGATYIIESTAGNVNINGNVTSTSELLMYANGGNITVTSFGGTITNTPCFAVSGTITINGNITTGAYVANSGGGTIVINGNCVGTSSAGGSYGVINGSTGSVTVNGSVTNLGTDYGVRCAGQTVVVTGNVSTTGTLGVFVSSGTCTINNSRIVPTGTTSKCVQQTGGTLIINNCTLIATASGLSIANSSTVLIYGACQANLGVGTSVTQEVGILLVNSNVV